MGKTRAVETTRGQRHKGHQGMEAALSSAAQVRRRFTGGRKRTSDLILKPARALLESWIMLGELQDAMQNVGLSPEDIKITLVLLGRKGLRDSGAHIWISGGLERFGETYESLKRKVLEFDTASPVGLVVHQRDPEQELPGGPPVAVNWSIPWQVNDLARRALSTALVQVQIQAGGGGHDA